MFVRLREETRLIKIDWSLRHFERLEKLILIIDAFLKNCTASQR